MNQGALSHLRVLDLSRVLAGPWASQLLGDLGAEVIKVERPGSGDDTRAWGPPWFEAGGRREAAYYLATNRNKQSVAIDITRPDGQELVRQLAREADVVIENYKVGGLAKYGLDYGSLRAENPRLVYCSITGFGQDGPYAERPGYDFLLQAMGGLMSLTGEPDGPPQKVGVALTDILTGLYATVGILAALAHRERSGEGQHIDLALLDVQVACLANQAMNYLVSGRAPTRMGNAHPNIVPYQAFPTADGDMVLTIGNDRQWAAFCELAGRPEWATDPRFATNAARVENRRELIPLLRQTTVARSTDDWVAALESAGVPGGPINDLARVFADPQIVHRGLRTEVDSIPQVANPLRLSATPPVYRNAPPAVGEHTDAVLARLPGMGAARIAALRREGTIG
ncbi:CaiB/BaiF CoA transferase family protein [Pseudothauera rhizosphaerae]|uniref:CoA transferase n=1 Tax=Pseudothauera rhizosphaerae TaxID=2565932 RepID=A0A4S4ABC3_9RHOO|nr:CaiB/BaiF CoA-transferase family protein [Pseudothauera rhizosphaerae]THF56212.1 CoA transferase [Pseudothauera rhizosphaerae]